MINTNALKPLGNNWDIIKTNTKEFSLERIAGIEKNAQNNNLNSRPDRAMHGLDTHHNTATNSITQFSAENGFTYLGEIGEKYAILGFDKNVKKSHFVDLSGASNADITTDYIKSLPAWTRGNSLPSSQIYALTGEIGGFSVVMFVDRITIASYANGNEGLSNYSYRGVIAVQLHKIFPQMVLDSNKNDKWLVKTNSAAIDASQKINLEANFSNYYDFYSPKGINANSLSVLAPNFMQMLIESSATFDVEFFGDKIYLTTEDPLFTVNVMNDAINALEVQLKYLKRLEASWDYQPLEPPFDVLKQTKIVNFYSVKFGPLRIGLVQLILILFALFAGLIIMGPVIMMFLMMLIS